MTLRSLVQNNSVHPYPPYPLAPPVTPIHLPEDSARPRTPVEWIGDPPGGAVSHHVPGLGGRATPEVGMEEFIFAGNRRRWRYWRPIMAAAGIAMGLWFGALCWALLRSPALPDLGLGAAPPSRVARVGTLLARGRELHPAWAMR
jgi:hypothetical protein